MLDHDNVPMLTFKELVARKIYGYQTMHPSTMESHEDAKRQAGSNIFANNKYVAYEHKQDLPGDHELKSG